MTLTISWQQCWQILETFGRHSLLTKILCGWRLCPTDILTEWTAAAWTDFYDSMRKSWKKSQNKNYTAYETCFNPFKCNTVLNQRNSWYVKYYVSARFLACFSLIFNWPKNTKSNILQHSAKTQPTEYFCCIYQCKTVNNRSMGGVYLSRTRFFSASPPWLRLLSDSQTDRRPDRKISSCIHWTTWLTAIDGYSDSQQQIPSLIPICVTVYDQHENILIHFCDTVPTGLVSLNSNAMEMDDNGCRMTWLRKTKLSVQR